MNVQSNIITDFGYGDQYFLDPGAGASNSFFGSMYFNHELCSWQTGTIHGSVIVPQATILRADRPDILNTIDPAQSMSSISLANLIQTPATVTAGCGDTTAGLPPVAMTVGVTPSAGQAAVIEKSQVYIGAPLASDILGLAPRLAQISTTSWFTQVTTTPAEPSLSGLEIVGAGASAYTANIPGTPVICYGDIVVNGVLLLSDPAIETDNQGCRIYVTGSAFIQGKIQYSGPGTTPTLQISSARAILLGFNSATLNERLFLPEQVGTVDGTLTASDRANVLPYAFTRLGEANSNDNQAVNQAILGDSLIVNGLVDADQLDPALLSTYAFTHLLLNAPQIHSRYALPFQGSLIGEIVLFRLNQFVFTFDPAFNSVPALPALPNDVLIVK